MIKYCLPIIETKLTDVLAIYTNNKANYHYFEVWIDYIDDFNKSSLDLLVNEIGQRLIIVFRRQRLEPVQMPLKQRLCILQALKNSSILVDLDLFDQQNELKSLTHGSLHILLSYHNYEQTPSLKTLRGLITQMQQYHPKIYKIATLCRNETDAIRLLQLQTELKTSQKPHIVLGMGKEGLVTRIFGTLWGNEMIFAPTVQAKASATGQLTYKQLKIIFKNLNQYGR